MNIHISMYEKNHFRIGGYPWLAFENSRSNILDILAPISDIGSQFRSVSLHLPCGLFLVRNGARGSFGTEQQNISLQSTQNLDRDAIQFTITKVYEPGPGVRKDNVYGLWSGRLIGNYNSPIYNECQTHSAWVLAMP